MTQWVGAARGEATLKDFEVVSQRINSASGAAS
jgi:hypothetical protein